MLRRPPSFLAATLIALFALFIVACGSDQGRSGGDDTSAQTDVGSSEDVPNRPPEDVAPRDSGPPIEGPPPNTIADCDPFEEGMNLNVCTASYLGDTNGAAAALAITPDGHIWIAGDFAGSPAPGLRLLEEGTGYLLKLSPTGDAVVDAVRIGSNLTSLSLDTSSAALLVTHDAGVTAFDPEAKQVLWRDDAFLATRADFDAGHAVALADKKVRVYDPAGAVLTTIDIDRSSVQDVAIHGELELVYVTGYQQVSGNLQQPFLYAYDFEGQRLWRNWDWSAAEAGNLSSDTRGYVVTLGKDRKLYYGGESHGGVTTHFKDPKDLAIDAPIVRHDPYSQSHNWNGAAPLGFVSRHDPSTGAIEAAQLLAVRLSNGKGNGVSPKFITAREDGVIFVAGGSACCIDKWDERTVAGERAMPEYGGGQWIMVLPADFSTRHVWTTFRADASDSKITAIDTWGESMAVVQNHVPRRNEEEVTGSLITSNAMGASPSGPTSAAHFALFPGP